MSVAARELSPEEQEAKYKARRDLISILLLISGTILITISVGFLFGALYALLVLGTLITILAILIGSS
jgi:uncharacterized membrane protein